jgi:hypothetical protein
LIIIKPLFLRFSDLLASYNNVNNGHGPQP